MIETYWEEMFATFKVGEGTYNIPGFPEPLMSPQFGVKNIIGEKPENTKASFKLCYFEPIKANIHGMKIEPLSKTLTNKAFWSYQKHHHSEALPFIQKILPFLATLSHEHWHVYFEDEQGIKASTIVGKAPSVAFFFNASVRKEERKSGLCRELLNAARVVAHNRPGFYWTVHPWLTLDASEIHEYHIVQ